MTPLEEIASTLRDHYQEQGYTVDLAFGIIGHHKVDWHKVDFFTQNYKHMGTLFLTRAGIQCTRQRHKPPARGPLYDYADPQLIDQLDKQIQGFYQRSWFDWLTIRKD